MQQRQCSPRDVELARRACTPETRILSSGQQEPYLLYFTPAKDKQSVCLQSNPTTGYQWSLLDYGDSAAASSYDVCSHYDPPLASTTGAAGAPGTQYFVVRRSARRGQQQATQDQMTLVYRRSWESLPSWQDWNSPVSQPLLRRNSYVNVLLRNSR